MTLSIAFVFDSSDAERSAHLLQILFDVAQGHGYRVSAGTERCLGLIKPGVDAFLRGLGDPPIAFLHAPANSGLAEAWEVATALEPGNSRNDFLDFLDELSVAFRGVIERLTIIFAINWRPNQKMRLITGTENGLKSFLKRPCGWCDELYIPENNTHWCDDEIPLMYRLELN